MKFHKISIKVTKSGNLGKWVILTFFAHLMISIFFPGYRTFFYQKLCMVPSQVYQGELKFWIMTFKYSWGLRNLNGSHLFVVSSHPLCQKNALIVNSCQSAVKVDFKKILNSDFRTQYICPQLLLLENPRHCANWSHIHENRCCQQCRRIQSKKRRFACWSIR